MSAIPSGALVPSLLPSSAPVLPPPVHTPDFIQDLLDLEQRDMYVKAGDFIRYTDDPLAIEAFFAHPAIKARYKPNMWDDWVEWGQERIGQIHADRQKKEHLSDAYALELAQSHLDGIFLDTLLSLVSDTQDRVKLSRFLQHPAIQTRLGAYKADHFRNFSMRDQFHSLITFLHKNATVLDPVAEQFVQEQLGRIQTFVMICESCKIDLSWWRDFKYDWEITQLLHSPKISKAIKESLQTIYNTYSKKDDSACPAIKSVLQQEAVAMAQEADPYSKNVLYLAFRLGNEIDCNVSQPNGIRLWIHQPPDGPNRSRDLLAKHLEEFRSGRRNFVYVAGQEAVPLRSYKLVMLYIIEALKRDCPKYYQENPEYLRIKENQDFKETAEHLIDLEAQIRAANTDGEIQLCLETFRKHHKQLRNSNIDLTLASSIHPDGLDPAAKFKPVPIAGVPVDLNRLIKCYHMETPAMNLGGEKLLEDFGVLLLKAHHHPQEVTTALTQLKALFSKLLRDPDNIALRREFLDLWSSIPQGSNLTDKSPEYDLKGFVDAVERGDKIDFKKHPLSWGGILLSAPGKIIFPVEGLGERIQAFRQALATHHRTRLEHLQQVYACLAPLKEFIVKEVMPKKNLYFAAREPIQKVLRLLNNFEFAIVNECLQLDQQQEEKKGELGDFSEPLCLLTEIAAGQGVLDSKVSDYKSLKQALEKAQKERVPDYSQLKKPLINSPEAITLLDAQGLTVEGFMQRMQTEFHTGMIAVLDRLLKSQQPQGLSGLPTQTADVIGRLRVVSPFEDFPVVQKGDILVIENCSADVHHYKGASAIIAREGGVFSHAAISFSEMGIPALLGCDIDKLRQLNGKIIHLHLAELPSIQPLAQDAVQIFENLEQPDLHTARAIDALPESDTKKTLLHLFYKTAFEKLPAQALIELPSSKSFIENQRTEIAKLGEQLYAAHHPIKKTYLFNKLRKKLHKLHDIVTKIDAPLAQALQQRLIDLERAVPDRQRVVNVSGKIENLDYIQGILPQIATKKFKLAIPPYLKFTADTLVWDKNPQLKAEVLALLHSDLTDAEKSQRIVKLIADIPFDDLDLKDHIFRSSAKLEDQTSTAAAGIFKSVLPERGTPDAFREVLASAFSEKALAFFGPNESLLSMSWLVQKYVSKANSSGVAFSVADETNWDIAGIQAVPGLGGAVDGAVTPTSFFVDTRINMLSDFRHDQKNKLPIDAESAKEIATVVKQLEKHYGRPVEIEFAVEGDVLNILQIRPITRYN